MITIPWWVVPFLLALAGAAAFWAATTLVLGRVDAVLTAVLAGLQAQQEAEALEASLDPGLPPPVDPWTSWRTLHDGLPDTTAPELPEHTWWGTRSGSPPNVPEAAVPPAKAAEPVTCKPETSPYDRFGQEPKAPQQIEVSVGVDGDVRSEKVPVNS